MEEVIPITLTFIFLIITALISPLLLLFPKKTRVLVGTFLVILIILAFSDLLLGPVMEDAVINVFLQNFDLVLPVVYTHPYGRIVAFGFTLVGALAILYGLDVSKTSEKIISLFALASAVGIVFANHFILLFAAWELLTISATGLILVHGKPKAIQMGLRFLLIQLCGGLFLFTGIIMHHAATGSLELSFPAAGLPLFILGIGIKTAFIPLHFWLPWAYPSASFSSSVLLSILTTKAGVYAVARILPSSNFIALMGASMAVFGILLAIIQTDLRRLLSYHIISQVGYMVAGVGLGTYLAVDGGLLHLFNHMLYKSLLFMSAGAIIFTTGTENLHDLQETKEKEKRATWKTLPVATLAATVGALAIAGSPPFNGYVSKYLLKYATAGVNPVSWMLLIASVGTALSFSKFVYFGFIRSRIAISQSLPFTLQLAMAAGATGCLLFGIKPEILAPLLPHASSLNVYSLSGISGAYQPLLAGVLLFILLKKILDPAHEHKNILPAQFLKSCNQFSNTVKELAAFYKIFCMAGGYIEEINRGQGFYVICLAYILIIIFAYFYFV